ncbi:MAG TPA: cupredoxin domain-containing protein [Candidatus Thermoplasmatota archaeon]|nr:cupredoxin domain-containing protein [Candidatus Thermoplasmatota archaeon]
MSRLLVLALLVLPIALAGCASPPPVAENDDVDPSEKKGLSGGNNTLNLTLPEPVELSVSTAGQYPVNPAFAPKTLSAPANATVVLVLKWADTLPLFGHDWVLEGVDGAKTKVINSGQTNVTFVAPAPGAYKFFCSVSDHRARGMEGAFTVA